MRTRKVGFALLFLLVAGATSAFAQTRVVTGRVTNATTNAPVVSAQITVGGTTITTVTDADGSFTVGVPVGTVQLIVRRIGFKRNTASVSASAGTVQITLEPDVLRLDEVVVTGQATGMERRNLPNAVSTVSGEDMAKVPAATIERFLQGRVAGANIQSNSGAPGGGIAVELRGVTSFIGRSPLYVLDGVIVSDDAIPSNVNEVTNAAGGSNPSLTQDNQVNRIVDINPADIETIEILKGASASAIYGSKASNGVVIITTRRGRPGAPQINVSQRFGFSDLAKNLTREFETAADVDAAFGAGTAAAFNFDPERNVEEALAGRNALSYESSVSVSGGDASTRYFVSGLWKDDEGIMPNTGFEKQSLRLNLDQTVSDRFRFQVSSNMVHTLGQRGVSNNDNTGTSPWFVLASTPRFVDLSQQADGSYPLNPFERSNPIQTMELMRNDEDVWRFIGSARVEADLVQSDRTTLQIIAVGGVDRFSQDNELLFPPDLQFEGDDGLPGTSLLSSTASENINVSGNVVLQTSTVDGNVISTTSAGVQYETRDLNTARITTRNILAGQANINQGSNIAVNEARNRVEDFGLYLQEEVLLNDRLMLTAGIRADQSSANTESDKLFFYPKGAASYRIPMNSGLLEEVKLRAAYGESGNQPLFGQQFSPLEGRVNIESILGLQVPAGINNQIVATDIEPERQREFEAGVDATFAAGRANLEATFFHKRVSDLLLSRQLSPSTGFTQEIFNGGKMRINGFEVALGLVPVQTNDVTWVLRSTFATNTSEITELPVPGFFPQNSGFGPDLGQFRIEEGQSATSIWGNIPDGAGGANLGKIGDSNPDFRAGLTSDITFGDFNVFGLLDWQKGGEAVNLTRLLFDAGNNSADCTNDPETDPCLGSATNPGRLRSFGTNTAVYLESTTFLKLRELTVSWALPQSFVSGVWGALDNARLSLSGRDLITVTDYSGFDPEVSNFGNQAIGRNIDVAPFPRSRSFWFGLDVGF
jgi:TonB-linked SusC/RagA family outer membrane protein